MLSLKKKKKNYSPQNLLYLFFLPVIVSFLSSVSVSYILIYFYIDFYLCLSPLPMDFLKPLSISYSSLNSWYLGKVLPWWFRWYRICLQCGRPWFDLLVGRSPGGGHGNPLQYSCLENLHGQGSLVGYSPWGGKEPRHDWVTKHTRKVPRTQ